MIDLNSIQSRIYQNKLRNKFNVTDANLEFTNVLREVVEAIDAYNSNSPELGEELADIILFVIGIAAILNINIEHELISKLEINEHRQYKIEHGKFIKIT